MFVLCSSLRIANLGARALQPGAHVGGYVIVVDADGQRHAIRAASVSAMSDADAAQDETILQIGAGRTVRIPVALEVALTWFGLGMGNGRGRPFKNVDRLR